MSSAQASRYDCAPTMRILRRSLHFYVAASTIYAAVVFLAVQWIYTIQLAESGLGVWGGATGDVLSAIQNVSFAVWLGLSLIAAVIVHRLASAFASARSEGEQKEQVLGSIFGLSSALAGPLDLEEIGRRFLSTVRGALDREVTVALIVYDDVLEAFRTIAADGPMGADLHGQTYSASALPAIIRTRVIDHRRSLILSNTGTDAETWAKLSHDMPQVASARSFGALPIVSRERLVGALLLLSGRARGLAPDRAPVPLTLGQYVAASIHTALSVSEAEARAERETMVNRVAQ